MSETSISTDPLQGHWWADNPLAGTDSLESGKKQEDMGIWNNSWSKKSPRKTRSDEDLRPRNDATSVAKGSRKNNFQEFAPGFVPDWSDLRERNRRRRKDDVEDCASKDRPKMA